MAAAKRRAVCMPFLEGRPCAAGAACADEHVDPRSERGARIFEGQRKRRLAIEAHESANRRAAASPVERSTELAPSMPDLSSPASQLDLERQFVIDVYDEIAPHFSATRYKPWPLVDLFLRETAAGSVVADVGCGNGKYMLAAPHLAMVGCDRSAGLLREARVNCGPALGEVVLADGLMLPWRDGCVDAAVCIAVVHHFASPARRAAAIAELARVVRPGGRVLVTVWAIEQERKVYAEQDVFVAWHLKRPNETRAGGESAADPCAAIDETAEPPSGAAKRESASAVHHRYYHLFRAGELEALVATVPSLRLVNAAYDRDNWYALAERVV